MRRCKVCVAVLLLLMFAGQAALAQGDDDWVECRPGIKWSSRVFDDVVTLFESHKFFSIDDGDGIVHVMTLPEYLELVINLACESETNSEQDLYRFEGDRGSQNFHDIDLTPGLWSFEVSPPAMLSTMSIKTESANCVESYTPEMIMLDATLQVNRDCTAYINVSYTNMELSTEYTFTIQKLN